MYKKTFILLYTVTVSLLFFGCAGQVVTLEQKILHEADSLFNAGNYEYAKLKYAKVRDSKPESQFSRIAQYQLGYINIYYENPFSNWEAALREFELFASLYPDDFRIGEVNSWIRMLVTMRSFKKNYTGTTEQLQQLKTKIENRPRLTSNIETITESLRNCYNDKDSLMRKTKELENVILDLERKCQQAGR
ncbi:MAG TPA: hypothetical protein VKY57_04400 [Chitinispirillaceae bacterium]|nr:hypothetical protein [Chitinispirillaceae bacterium]